MAEGWLVLTRQRDEIIKIGDEIEVRVMDVRGDKCRLGIRAPRHIPVHRLEVYNATQREDRAARNLRIDDLPGGQK